MIVGGLDIHRTQITFDWVDHDTGEAGRGKVTPAVRPVFAEWLGGLQASGAFALEATTGWRYVVLVDANFDAHLAEPAETARLRGPKRRAKTDKRDARQPRELLEVGWLPESWIPPGHIADLRQTVRLRKKLADGRTCWQQRMHAVCTTRACPSRPGGCSRETPGGGWPGRTCPRRPSRYWRWDLRHIDFIEVELIRSTGGLRAYAARQSGCRALMDAHYGFGAIVAPTVIAEFGDMRRFDDRDAAVRYTGLDVTVYSSDGKRDPGKLSRQGPPRCGGRCTRRPSVTRGPGRPTSICTRPSRTVSTANWRR